MKEMRCRECVAVCGLRDKVINHEISIEDLLKIPKIKAGDWKGNVRIIYCDDFEPEPKPKSKLDSDNISSVIYEFKKTLENHGLIVVDWNADTRITERKSKGMIVIEVVPKWEYLKSEETQENND